MMSFEKMELSPDARSYVHPAFLDPVRAVPPTSFFQQEAAYWSKHFRKVPPPDGLDKGVLPRLVEDLHAISEQWHVARFYKETSSYQAWATGRQIFAAAQSRVAFSRFWREKRFLEAVTADMAGEEEPPTLCPDFPVANFNKGGLHAQKDFVKNLSLAYPDHGAVTWHEGQEVFVRVSTPATPTLDLHIGYRRKFGHRSFPEDEFATVVPFLKSEVWDRCIPIAPDSDTPAPEPIP
jgi:hypothetical protein